MRKIIFLSLILIFLPVTNGFSQTLKVGTGEFSPTIGSNLKYGGYASHMLRLAFESQGITLDIEYVPWKRALIGTKNGDYDLTYYWYCSEDRRIDFYCGDALVESKMYFFHLKTTSFDWKTYADLSPYFIGFTSSYHYSKELMEMIAAGEVNSFESAKDIHNFNMLLAKRIDIFPMTELEGLYLISKSLLAEQAEQITFHPKTLLNTTGHVMFPKNAEGSLKWMAIYNKGLSEIKAQGILEEYKIKMINGWYEQ